MFTPSPGLWPGLIGERQRRLHRMSRRRRAEAARANGLRVRLGHLLIAAGSNLSGERMERPAPSRALPRSA